VLDFEQAARSWAEEFPAFEARLGGRWPEWARLRRREALDRFADLGFPTTRREEWRHTNVTPIARTPFVAGGGAGTAERSSLDAHPLAGMPGSRLVFVDGELAPGLSEVRGLPEGVRVLGLAEAVSSEPELVEPWLDAEALLEDQAFPALNAAFLQDGAVVLVPDGTVVEDPVHLLFLSTSPSEATASHTRSLVLAGRSSQVTVVESHAAAAGGTYLTNAVTEIRAAENAGVDHYRVQTESRSAYHLATLAARQQRNSRVASHVFSLGAVLARSDVRVVFEGEGAEATLDGLYLVSGDQHSDNQTTVDHAVPRCRSEEVYRGILDGRGQGVFNGRVIVRPDAQKTEAHQSNRNLLLSDDVQAHTKPQLEINADDVKCSHGATIGRLDRDAVFYLRSRGLGEIEARRLLTAAFARVITDRVRVESLGESLDREIHRRLDAHGDDEVPA
jgi:Fe-S cluster assembly protein SufD